MTTLEVAVVVVDAVVDDVSEMTFERFVVDELLLVFLRLIFGFMLLLIVVFKLLLLLLFVVDVVDISLLLLLFVVVVVACNLKYNSGCLLIAVEGLDSKVVLLLL